MGNLFAQNTGLDDLYINGVPIEEISIDIKEVFSLAARISSLASETDPYIAKFPLNIRQRFQLHGNGDRITTDFLKVGAEDILPVFQSLQRWIPEGEFGGKEVTVIDALIDGDDTWTANDNVETVKEVNINFVSGYGYVTVYANETKLGTFQIDETNTVGQESLRGANQDVSELRFVKLGISDGWYIPTISELGEMQTSLYDLGYGGFNNGGYWSSTEVDVNDAYLWFFEEGENGYDNKDADFKVRLAIKILDDGYSTGSLITVFGENLWVWKIEDGYAYCVREFDESGLYTWSNNILSELNELFSYGVEIPTIERDGISWRQALIAAGAVGFPTKPEILTIYNLLDSYSWNNTNCIKAYEVTCKHESGSADIDVIVNGTVMGSTYTLEEGERNDDLRGSYDDISNISIDVTNKSEDFKFSLIINVGVADKLPSPRFEFDSVWNPGKVIYRFQNMDTRASDKKLNYTSDTYKDTVVDTNNFSNVRSFLLEGLKNHILYKLYESVGHDKREFKYRKLYENNRRDVAYWIKNNGNLQTQYHGYAGV